MKKSEFTVRTWDAALIAVALLLVALLIGWNLNVSEPTRGDSYAEGFNDALDAVMLRDLAVSASDAPKKTWGEIVDELRKRYKIPRETTKGHTP
jgi:hypothetical protein